MNLLRSNSNLHACFGYACHHANLAKQFPACENCIQKLSQNHPVTICNVCHNWTLPTATNALPYKEPLVDIVPAQLLPSLQHITTHAVKLTTDLIKQMWSDCFVAMNNNTITVHDAIAQLQLICLDAQTIDLFIERWRNQTILGMILDVNEDVDPILQDNIEAMVLSTPSEFQDFKWSSALEWCPLDAWVETPMHL